MGSLPSPDPMIPCLAAHQFVASLERPRQVRAVPIGTPVSARVPGGRDEDDKGVYRQTLGRFPRDLEVTSRGLGRSRIEARSALSQLDPEDKREIAGGNR